MRYDGTTLAEETGLQKGVPPVISGALGRDMELLTFAAEGDPLWATTSTRSSLLSKLVCRTRSTS